MTVGSCGVLDLSRVYPKTPFEPMFYSWWNCPVKSWKGSKKIWVRNSLRKNLLESDYEKQTTLFRP